MRNKGKNTKYLFFSLIVIALLVSSGYTKRTDVYLSSYSVSKDLSSIEINISLASSMGYTRGYKVENKGTGKYITFYSAFGGLNSDFGAKTKFKVDLEQSYNEVYFYHGDGRFTLVLRKDLETNKWLKA